MRCALVVLLLRRHRHVDSSQQDTARFLGLEDLLLDLKRKHVHRLLETSTSDDDIFVNGDGVELWADRTVVYYWSVQTADGADVVTVLVLCGASHDSVASRFTSLQHDIELPQSFCVEDAHYGSDTPELIVTLHLADPIQVASVYVLQDVIRDGLPLRLLLRDLRLHILVDLQSPQLLHNKHVRIKRQVVTGNERRDDLRGCIGDAFVLQILLEQTLMFLVPLRRRWQGLGELILGPPWREGWCSTEAVHAAIGAGAHS